MQSLKGGHTYTLRAILNWRDSSGGLHLTYSNLVSARVADYAELCVKEFIAEKFKPVLHHHPDDLQPEGLINVENVEWAARTAAPRRRDHQVLGLSLAVRISVGLMGVRAWVGQLPLGHG